MSVLRLKNREIEDEESTNIEFKDINNNFIINIITYTFEHVDFFQKLFETPFNTNQKVPSIFLGTRKVKKTRKKYTEKKEKLFNFLAIDVHYFISILYEIILIKNREFFYQDCYDKDKKMIYGNVNYLFRFFNSQTDLFVSHDSGFITEAIYKIKEEYYYTEQIIFNYEKLNNFIKRKFDTEIQTYFSNISINSSDLIFYRDNIKNCKKSVYTISRRDWFIDLNTVEEDAAFREFYFYHKKKCEMESRTV